MYRHKAEYNYNQKTINQQKGKKVYIAILERMKKAFSKEYNFKYCSNYRINKKQGIIPKRHLLTTIFLFLSAPAVED